MGVDMGNKWVWPFLANGIARENPSGRDLAGGRHLSVPAR